MMKNTYNNMLKEIEMNCQALKLNKKIEEEAVRILDKYLLKESLRGKRIEQYSSAVIYLACKRWNYPITTTKINEVLDLDVGKTKGSVTISRVAKHIGRTIEEGFQPISVDKYIEMAQAKVSSDSMCQTRALMLLEWIKQHNIEIGHNSPAFGTAIAYIADRIEGWHVSEKTYARSIGTSEVSLRNYKRILLKAIPNIKKRGTRYYWKEDIIPINDTTKQ